MIPIKSELIQEGIFDSLFFFKVELVKMLCQGNFTHSFTTPPSLRDSPSNIRTQGTVCEEDSLGINRGNQTPGFPNVVLQQQKG